MIKYEQYAQRTMEKLGSGGVFLTVKADGKVNTMTMGWGGLTVFWGAPVFVVPVRLSRYTHDLLERSGVFTVSIPDIGSLKDELIFCGTKSGRDYDKFAECNLTPVSGRSVDCPVIGQATLHYECKILARNVLDSDALNPEIQKGSYGGQDWHELYYGEIVNVYTT